MIKWLKIIRPQTLFASVCPVAVGLLCVAQTNRTVAVLTLFCALSLQIFSNLVNDYYDFRRGADKAGRVGPQRALAEGTVSERAMLIAVRTAFSIAVATGALLLLTICNRGSWLDCWPIVLIGVTSLLFAWLYTATNRSLSYLGIADIFVFLYYGVIASAGTAYLQTLTFSWRALLLGAVCGLISMCVLIINNLRDINDDAAVGKRTFPVRFGKPAGEIGMLVVVLLMPVFVYAANGWHPAMLILLPALALFIAVRRANGRQYNICLLCAGLLNAVYVLLLLL